MEVSLILQNFPYLYSFHVKDIYYLFKLKIISFDEESGNEMGQRVRDYLLRLRVIEDH